MSQSGSHSPGFDLERRRAEHTHVLVVGPYLVERAARLGGDARVRHDGGVLGERLDAAEALGDAE